MEFKRISIDTSKYICTLHGVDGQDSVILRRELRRRQVETFFAKLAPTEVALEACAGAHHWGRTLGAMGHRVKLIPPQYVKPFVKRSKNNRNDAEAISEATSRPIMRTVSVKTVDEQATTKLRNTTNGSIFAMKLVPPRVDNQAIDGDGHQCSVIAPSLIPRSCPHYADPHCSHRLLKACSA